MELVVTLLESITKKIKNTSLDLLFSGAQENTAKGNEN